MIYMVCVENIFSLLTQSFRCPELTKKGEKNNEIM